VAIQRRATAHDWSYRTVGITALLLGVCLVVAFADRLLGPWRLPEGPTRSIDSMALGSVVLALAAIGARHRAASDRMNTVTGYMLGVIGLVVIPVDLALGASADSVLALSLVLASRLALIGLAVAAVFPQRRTSGRIGHRILGTILGVFIAAVLVSIAARAAGLSIETLNDVAFVYPAVLMMLIALPFGASSIRRRQPQGLILAFTLIAFAVADVHWGLADSLAGASSRLMRFVALGAILVLTMAELRDLALHERAVSLRAQNESERAADRLVAQLSMQERFVHDTRNALLAIQGGLRSLIDESNTAMVSAVSSEVDRLRTLLDTSDSDPLPRNFDLVEAIQPMVACYAASGHDISLMAEGRVMARGRPSMTAEIAQNLIENAIHYGSSGDIAIWVLSKGEFAEVRVADRGAGVDIDLRDAIFERGTSGGSSSGVGLHISRRLVESQGGLLTLSDRHGGGTIFSFTVPIGGHTPQAQTLDLAATP
jgi:signal transduction histidine kinase